MPKTSSDPFTEVRAQTLRHRAQHGCGAYPFDDGAILGSPARHARTTARCSRERGAELEHAPGRHRRGDHAHVDTVELDPEHVRLARANFSAFAVEDRVTVHQGDFAKVLPKLQPGYDLAFFDGFSPSPDHLRAFHRLLRARGVLISSNLHFRDAQTRAYRDLIFDGKAWLTAAIADGDTAMSIRL
jgi:hypothetical protein